MSEVFDCAAPVTLPHDVNETLLAAIKVGCATEPAKAGAALAEKLAALGPWVQKVIQLIESGMTNLPAILAALQAAGVSIPAWA